MVPWLDEVDEEDDWRWRFIDGEWSVDEERDGKVLDELLFGWRGRSVRGPVGINVGDWSGEGFWLSCSFDIRARFIDPKYVDNKEMDPYRLLPLISSFTIERTGSVLHIYLTVCRTQWG